MKVILFAALVALLLVASTSAAVVELTDANFDEQVKEGNWLIKFFAPWCGHCKRLAPTWDSLAEKVTEADGYKVAKVDCTVNKAVCEKAAIRGYPTLYFYKNGAASGDRYSGERTEDALHKFALSKVAAAKDL